MCSQGQHADLAQEKDRISLCSFLVCFHILLESRQSHMLALPLGLDTNCVPFCLSGSFLTESVTSQRHLQLHLEAQTLHNERVTVGCSGF